MSLNIENLTIKEAREIAAMFPAAISSSASLGTNNRLAADGEIRIAVLQRGHVVVGEYSQNGEIGRLDNARVVRRWGTSEGLGELAKKGPLSNTVLDACPPVSFHVREVIFLMEVNNDAWGKLGN